MPESDLSPQVQAAMDFVGDTDELVSSLAMEKILQSGQAEQALATIQDDPDENTRRHAHQLGTLIQRKHILKSIVSDFEQARLPILTAMVKVDLLYDTSSSLSFLNGRLQELYDDFAGWLQNPSVAARDLNAICEFMDERGFYVPPLPWLGIEEYLLGDVMDNYGDAVPLVLAALCQELGKRNHIKVNVIAWNGFIALLDRLNGTVCVLEKGWEAQKLERRDQVVHLNDQQLFLLYLNSLLASSIACWEAYDVHLFWEILQAIHGIQGNPLPYPFGEVNEPEPPPQQGA